MEMKDRLQELANRAKRLIEEAESPEKLNDARVAFLGKKGELTARLKSPRKTALPSDSWSMRPGNGSKP